MLSVQTSMRAPLGKMMQKGALRYWYRGRQSRYDGAHDERLPFTRTIINPVGRQTRVKSFCMTSAAEKAGSASAHVSYSSVVKTVNG
jgi:hypothetical protein